jgi:hypothetical protein
VASTDTAGHGTHVAGTVGGLGVMSSGKYAGVAPGVDIVGSTIIDCRTFTWVDRPTVTAPGVDIASTRAPDVLTPLGIPGDAEQLEPEHVPYYTVVEHQWLHLMLQELLLYY